MVNTIPQAFEVYGWLPFSYSGATDWKRRYSSCGSRKSRFIECSTCGDIDQKLSSSASKKSHRGAPISISSRKNPYSA